MIFIISVSSYYSFAEPRLDFVVYDQIAPPMNSYFSGTYWHMCHNQEDWLS